MKKLLVLALVAIVVLLAGTGCSSRDPEVLNINRASASESGIALAIVYDNSGSMDEDVLNEAGEKESKKDIARRALVKVIESLKSYSDLGSKKIQVGVVTFGFGSPSIAVDMQDFNYETLLEYADHTGGGQNTPLGVSIEAAAGLVLQSPMNEKHIIILSDGLNNMGPDPIDILSSPEYVKVTSEYPVGSYFVAFDISGDQFSNLEPLGVKIFEATDEKDLDLKFSEILVKEILFEDPEQ